MILEELSIQRWPAFAQERPDAMFLPKHLRRGGEIDPRASTHTDNLDCSLSSKPLKLGPEILFSLWSDNDPQFNAGRTEEATSDIDVPRTGENENFLQAESERLLPVYPQWLIIDAVVVVRLFTERVRTDQLRLMVRPQEVHQPTIFSAP
jgi:hypothetical protein